VSGPAGGYLQIVEATDDGFLGQVAVRCSAGGSVKGERRLAAAVIAWRRVVEDRSKSEKARGEAYAAMVAVAQDVMARMGKERV
jgi:hypothetical protein